MASVSKTTAPHPIQFYRLHQLKARLGVSGSSIWSWVQKGTFPKPIKLSDRCTAWEVSSVERWANERIEASRKTAGGAA